LSFSIDTGVKENKRISCDSKEVAKCKGT